MRKIAFAAVLTGLLSLLPLSANATGALAIGEPQNLADGFASGWSTGQANEDIANAKAYEQCRDKADAPDHIRALCKVVRTFNNQCVAIALDTEPGATGTGYAVAPSKAEAERQALDDCRSTAGNRSQYCRIINGGCDGNAR
ncbi:MAG: DUF4189 domain-containing protein [Xanthobacteraceae bacterium]|nr:DUF4189 domain-containing protein [Xanthobacteraceae bacterium]